jgi:hypothetical protein
MIQANELIIGNYVLLLSYSNSTKIQYIHQLQNLYWSLTQKELQIEL